MSRRLVATAGAGIAVALVLRVWVLSAPFGALDSDEAVWGLMARHALDGEPAVFFWDQAYGGTQEVFLTAPVLAVAGWSTLGLRLVPLALFALACVLVWRVGRRTVGDDAAVLGAVVFAIAPAYVVWKSTRAHGFYGAGLVLALLILLLVLRLAERETTRDAAGLGAALGLGWWATPQIAFVAVPALAWLVWRARPSARGAAAVVATAAAGALPWLAWNLAHGWQSLETPFEPGGDTYVDHLRTFFYATFPTLLGLRAPFSLEWLPGVAVGRIAEAAALGAFVWAGVRARGRNELLLIVAAVYPFIQAASPYASLNDEPRYLVLLAPVIALLLGALLARLRAFAPVALAGIAALSLAGLIEMSRHDPPVPPVGRERVPADLRPVLRMLDAARIEHVFAPYSIAYRITFESGERILATSTGHVRYEPHDRAVRAAQRVAYVFVPASYGDVVMARPVLRRGFRRVRAGDWAVYLPPARSG